jgi:sulfate adenylyltransferase subunit 1
MLCWLSDTPLQPRGKYIIKHTSKEVRCMIKNILYKVDINTLHRIEGEQQIVSNDIARITLRTTQPLFIDSYSDNKSTGSIIIIDEATNNTVGAGMII